MIELIINLCAAWKWCVLLGILGMLEMPLVGRLWSGPTGIDGSRVLYSTPPGFLKMVRRPVALIIEWVPVDS